MESSTTFHPSRAATSSGRSVASLLAGANWKPEISAVKERSSVFSPRLIAMISGNLRYAGILEAARAVGGRVRGGGESIGAVGSTAFESAKSRDFTSVLN